MIKERIVKAYNLAKHYHGDKKRKYTNSDYFTHPKYVARIVEDITNDEDLIICALLHDTLEDTKISEDEIEKEFGLKVLNIIKELTSDKTLKVSKMEYLTNKMNNMSSDALIIKLADRYHNVKYLDKDCKTKEHIKFVKKYYTETIGIIYNLKNINNDAQKLLVDGIKFQLNYLSLKYKWD